MELKQDMHQIFTALPKLQENSENINGVNALLSANEEQEIHSDECYLPAQDVCFL